MESIQNKRASPSYQLQPEGEEGIRLILSGVLNAQTTGKIWREISASMERSRFTELKVDATGVTYCDGVGIGLLFDLKRAQKKKGGSFEIIGLREEPSRLLDLFDPNDFEDVPKRLKWPGLLVEIGRLTAVAWKDTVTLIAFIGELFVALLYAVTHPRSIRWKDAIRITEIAGVNALPIVALLSFLIGLVTGFQAAIALQLFGFEIYVAMMVSIGMFREMGPLMTAVILAGRSGSAFAAELGTMKVNEEIDALNTMGLDPVRFLAVSRVLAGTFVTPLLTIFANFFGLVGGWVVMLSLGFPTVTYLREVADSVTYVDLLGGLAKSVVFGVLVAAAGCMRGLQTRTGPSAVGESATNAVVSGIILIVVADGIFSVLYFYLGI